ncbi:MAG: HAMP domain-containing protein [Planctomycetaceae bacterium]|nr:HAMP domain-containing protein [Planctomycetaceae bacterium]
MSYRTIKKLLGETSLERKCRFLFGGGLMLLITGSFWFYGRLTSRLVYDQNEVTARSQVSSSLVKVHWKKMEGNKDLLTIIDEFDAAVKPEDQREISWKIVTADLSASTSPSNRPDDLPEADALERLKQGRRSVIDIRNDKGEYHYYGAVLAERSCLACHSTSERRLSEGDLMGMVKITIPLERTRKSLAWNNAILLATAILTAFLAMLAAYLIVRYVIVKPVLHLKDVSDEIAKGNLDLRADIRTGDEFEELSHAFNRMLRHLTTVQDELRHVNSDLDGKVDELAQVNLRLYEMNKLKDEFLATMSHELRTPLNSILGFSEVLGSSSGLTDRQKKFVKNIQTSGRDLLMLINDILDLAKIESGRTEVKLVEMSCADLVERQVNGIMPMAEKKNLNVSTWIDPDLPILSQDPGKLQQILNNLLSNAVKFTPEGGRVKIRAQRSGDKRFDLIVEDTGIGIPLEEQATVFEKFRQGRSIPGQRDALTREYGGTGLGLSIVKELARLLGGEVLLDSEFGKGSTFTIRLPIRVEEPSRRLEDDFDERPTPLPRPRLMRESSSALGTSSAPSRSSVAASPEEPESETDGSAAKDESAA